MNAVRTFHDLVVWRKAFELCLDVYRVTTSFPAHEKYGITSELRKTSRSVAYNIAEGHRRRSTTEYIRFLDIAHGSAAELETQLYLSRALTYLDEQGTDVLLQRLFEVERMLTALKRSLRLRQSRPSPSAD
ncbi:MAG TPA: four helix bundle protein [Polyangiaceae bacterium]|nr:four helix bundle protein [Polyangiaceae bacterium]